MQHGSLIARFARARRDRSLAVLEGLHPLKHALRFGARILEAVCSDPAELERLATELAPDVRDQMLSLAQPVAPEVFAQLVPLVPSTGVVSLAERPALELQHVLAHAPSAPLILLEDPRDLGNLGACVRVAAAAAAAGVLTTGGHDPWHPDAVRGAAGLHYALPVLRIGGARAIAGSGRPLVAVDPGGEPIAPAELPANAVLAFGGERYGLSADLLEHADSRVAIPMREGVSSLNLATSVAAVLFAWRLSEPR